MKEVACIVAGTIFGLPLVLATAFWWIGLVFRSFGLEGCAP